MSDYQSSEEIQRNNRAVFADETAKKEAEAQKSEKQKLHKVLDKYIDQHSKTSNVRKMASENKRTADYQLDLSADLVEILEKIKNELR